MREHNTTHTLPSKLEKKKNMEPIQRHTDKMTGKLKKKTNKTTKANENNKGNYSY
jgi:NADH:ubiquinone oxidoreductase subunit D